MALHNEAKAEHGSAGQRRGIASHRVAAPAPGAVVAAPLANVKADGHLNNVAYCAILEEIRNMRIGIGINEYATIQY